MQLIMNRWIKLLLFVGVPTVLLFSFWIVKHRSESLISKERMRQQRENTKKIRDPIYAAWKKIETAPVEAIAFDQLASNCPVRATPGLINQEQENKLRQALANYWRWSSQTNFEVYRDLRLKLPYVLNTPVIESLRKFLDKEHKAANWPTDSEAILRRVWDGYFSSCRIAEIGTNGMEILVVKQIHSFDNPMYEVVKAEIPGTTVITFEKLVEVHPTARETLQEHEEILCAFMRQFVRYGINGTTFKVKDAKAPPTPFHFSFYWSPELQQWLPWSLATHTMMGDARLTF